MKNDIKLEISAHDMFVTLSVLEKIVAYLKVAKDSSPTSLFTMLEVFTCAVDILRELQDIAQRKEEK